MQLSFVRNGNHKWGGDLKAIQDLQRGLHLIGHKSLITSDLRDASEGDIVCFIGTASVDHSSEMAAMKMLRREYGCIAFHEDELLFTGASYGFLYYVAGALGCRCEKDHNFSIEELFERPHLVFYFDEMKTINALTNYDFLKEARFVIAGSPTEERTLLRDVPGCKTRVLYWAPGFAEDLQGEMDDSFLKLSGLSSGSYIIQVGRMSLRKNQLASLLATQNLDVPLVFIVMGKSMPVYEKVFFEAAAVQRKAPIFIVSENVKFPLSPNIKMIHTPALLEKGVLLSAFAHAGLHLHPSFYELPGYTYLESARLGIPTVASEWGSLKDYFTGEAGKYLLDDRIEYALPYDLKNIKKLIEKKFGKKYPKTPLPPIFHRTAVDVARDFLECL